MSDWVLADPLQDVLKYRAFVYIITLPDGCWYVGRKNVYRVRAGAIIGESDWRTYWSSSKAVKDAVKLAGKDKCRREIIRLCESTGKAGWVETVELIERRAMLDPACLNGNVLRQYQRKVVQGWHNDERLERYMADTHKQRGAAGLLKE